MFATFKVLKNSDIKPLPDKEVKTMEVSKETLYPILYIHEKKLEEKLSQCATRKGKMVGAGAANKRVASPVLNLANHSFSSSIISKTVLSVRNCIKMS